MRSIGVCPEVVWALEFHSTVSSASGLTAAPSCVVEVRLGGSSRLGVAFAGRRFSGPSPEARRCISTVRDLATLVVISKSGAFAVRGGFSAAQDPPVVQDRDSGPFDPVVPIRPPGRPPGPDPPGLTGRRREPRRAPRGAATADGGRPAVDQW